jgi:hypothetical protein
VLTPAAIPGQKSACWKSHRLPGSIIPLVEGMFKEGLARHGVAPSVDAGLLATNRAWAVSGAARRWFQTPDRILLKRWLPKSKRW